MARPKLIPFTEALENVLLNIWGSGKSNLDDRHIKKTRDALVEIRGIYRFRGDFPGKYPSSIQYRLPKNRAGYLAAFGQRHAYLAYTHLNKVESINPERIPRPSGARKELTLTMIGAGAAIETFGVCLYYNQLSQKLNRLRLNLIERVPDWKPNRHTVFDKVLKGSFPRLEVVPNDIDIDITKDCVPKLADHYDNLSRTDILLIYNVLNEIHTKHARMVWKNVDFVVRICAKPILILLMEPSVPKARPRVNWLKGQLAQCSTLITESDEEEISFDSAPTLIDFEGSGVGLNDRLFGRALYGSRPLLQRLLKRTHIACSMVPISPISAEQVRAQLESLNVKRGKGGRFVGDPKPPQGKFWNDDLNWGRPAHKFI